jgi:uncharacterized protein
MGKAYLQYIYPVMGGQQQEPRYQDAEAFMLGRLSRELPPTLYYHGYHHTHDVMAAAMNIAGAEQTTEEERKLLRIAICFHDAGFIYVYKDHEVKGCDLAWELLPEYGFTPAQIEMICGMIMATRVPQAPRTHLENIICDADLDYLGRDDVFPIAQTLFEELKIHANLTDPKKWNDIQINFLSNHHYHTQFSQKNRQPKKEYYLNQLKQGD